jgi:hypothetical protein
MAVFDLAVYRPSSGGWFVRQSSDGATHVEFFGGLGDDVPVPADYGGDGRTDVAIFRASTATWYVLGQFTVQFGATGDIPISGRF